MRRATVWVVMHKIRKAMQTEQKELLQGIFEMDETYLKVGKESKNNNKDDNDKKGGGRSVKNNTSIVAIKQKGGDIKAVSTENTKAYTLLDVAFGFAKHGSEIHTYQYNSYKCFKHFYTHKSVFHKKEYVSAEGIHCNGVEGFWGLFKRGIKGQFHFISKKYLQNYLYEFEYRYNRCKVDENNMMNELIGRMLGI